MSDASGKQGREIRPNVLPCHGSEERSDEEDSATRVMTPWRWDPRERTHFRCDADGNRVASVYFVFDTGYNDASDMGGEDHRPQKWRWWVDGYEPSHGYPDTAVVDSKKGRERADRKLARFGWVEGKTERTGEGAER